MQAKHPSGGSYNKKLERIVDENLKAWPKRPMDKRKKHMEQPLSVQKYETVEDCIRKSLKKGA